MLLLCGPAKAEGVGFEFELFGGHDSNPSRAQTGSGAGAENIEGARMTLLRSVLLDERSGVILTGGGAMERHSAYPGLNNFALDVHLGYRIQPSVGYTMPWYGLSIDLERRKYADSVIRDRTSAALELSAGKHFTDRIYSTIGIGVRRNVADHAYVFDMTQSRHFINAGYKLSPQDTLYASLSRTRGDQVFGAGETYAVRGAVKVSDDDPVFGESYYAYRMEAVSNIVETGVNFPVGRLGSWDISAKRSRTHAYGGQAYDYALMSISWRYRFY